MHLFAAAVTIRVAVDAVDIVGRIKRVAGPRIRRAGLWLAAETLEQHHGNIDASLSRCDYSCAQSIEVNLIELAQIELGSSIKSRSRSGSLIGEWSKFNLRG